MATIVLQIGQFCNCEGCIQKVKKTLGELGGVNLLKMNPEIGAFTILTIKHPEVIKLALKRMFPKKDINLSQETNHPNPSFAFSDRYNSTALRQNLVSLVTPQGNLDVDDIANALVTMSNAKGLESMEFTQSTTFKINFTKHENQSTFGSTSNGVHAEDVGCEYVPTPLSPPPPLQTTRPTAPPKPTTGSQVYGYPVEFYGVQASSKADDADAPPSGCCGCTIL